MKPDGDLAKLAAVMSRRMVTVITERGIVPCRSVEGKLEPARELFDNACADFAAAWVLVMRDRLEESLRVELQKFAKPKP